MPISLTFNYPVAKVCRLDCESTIKTGVVRLAHMGCGLVGKLMPKPTSDLDPDVGEFLDRQYGSRKTWKDVQGSVKRLGTALHQFLKNSDSAGLTLVNTMRNGSDAWRGGGFLTDAVDHMRALRRDACLPPVFVEYTRFDELCPSRSLLGEFRNDSSMSFGQYARQYAQELEKTGAIELAAAETIRSNASGTIPCFFCTDPYIKGFMPASDWLTVDFQDRQFPEKLRFEGCHRVVLAELIAKLFFDKGFTIELFEIDQHHLAGAHQRNFNP